MNRKILLMIAVCGLIANSHQNASEFDSPSFLEDSLILNKATAVASFQSKLVTLLNSLSTRRHCRFVAQLAAKLGVSISRTQDLVNKLKNGTNLKRNKKTRKRSCASWQSKIDSLRKLFYSHSSRRKPASKSERLKMIRSELPSLYNNMPLPFQCEILFEVGRRSALKPFEASENSVNNVTKMSLYEVGNIIKKCEKALTSQISIVKNAERCVKVLAGKNYRTTNIIASVKLDNHPFKIWKRDFRAKIQWIMGKFAVDNGIKVDNLHNLTAKHNLPYSAYFPHILNSTQVGDRYEVRFHMHLAQANSRAMEARFVLAALDALKKKDLEKILEVADIKYWAVNHNIGTEIKSRNSYTLKMLFPSYLRRFFNVALQRHERCLIIHLMTHYSNSSNQKVTEFLKRKRIDVKFPCSIVNGIMSVVLSPKRNRESVPVIRKTDVPVSMATYKNHFWISGRQKSKAPITKKMKSAQKKIIHYRKATMVEIVMLVLLGSLAIVVVIFFITCTLFIVRKRRLRKEMKLKAQHQPVQQRQEGQGSETLQPTTNMEIGSSAHAEEDLASLVRPFMHPISLLTDNDPLRSDGQTASARLINVKLEPLRLSTDDEESRCDDNESVSLSPGGRHSGNAASLYRGGRRLVPAIRYSKTLARRLASADCERSKLERVPEKGTASHDDDYELKENDRLVGPIGNKLGSEKNALENQTPGLVSSFDGEFLCNDLETSQNEINEPPSEENVVRSVEGISMKALMYSSHGGVNSCKRNHTRKKRQHGSKDQPSPMRSSCVMKTDITPENYCRSEHDDSDNDCVISPREDSCKGKEILSLDSSSFASGEFAENDKDKECTSNTLPFSKGKHQSLCDYFSAKSHSTRFTTL